MGPGRSIIGVSKGTGLHACASVRRLAPSAMKAWNTAKEIAKSTPPRRNRYVDFLRAAAILVVVIGHWLAAAPHASPEGLQIVKMLGVAPWTHGLTWALQVMPVFFIVGGYANGASWEAALRDGTSYQVWVHARLNRLIAPLIPLLLVWAGITVLAGVMGTEPGRQCLGEAQTRPPFRHQSTARNPPSGSMPGPRGGGHGNGR